MKSKNLRELNLEELPAPWNIVIPFIVRAFVWASIFFILYLLRSFSLLIFLTFVFAYIQSHAVNRIKPLIQSRAIRVVLVGIAFLLLMIGLMSFLLPSFKDQAELFAKRYPDYMKAVDDEVVQMTRQYPVLGRLVPQYEEFDLSLDQQGKIANWNPRNSPSAMLLSELFNIDPNNSTQNNAHIIEKVRKITAGIIATGSAFLLSLLFSFLIVLDLPKLTRSFTSLADSKLAFIYHEASGNIANFARVLGSALEAQLFIAILNTVLTAIGVYLLGIDSKVAFLSLIVFICSFIPVAGVVISSIPICLLALQDGGISLVLLTVLLIWVIHMIEAYVLNPRIYGHHLRINPVLVLIILTIGGKLFGVWGLVLGLPVCTYVFQHAIRYTSSNKKS